MAAQVNVVIHPPGWTVDGLPVLQRTDGVYFLYDAGEPLGARAVKIYTSKKLVMRDAGYVVCDRCGANLLGVDLARSSGWSVSRPGGDECPSCQEGAP